MSFLEVDEQDSGGGRAGLERVFPLLDGPIDMDGMIIAFTKVGGHE
jgi:hypothetical protein